MTIAHEGSTGSPAASAQGTTSISVAYPSGVAAGRIAILVAAVKLSGAVFGTVTGFTPIGTQAGGTGASANDAGTTKVGVWYKRLTGSESGSVTVTNDVGVSSAGAMSIYSATTGIFHDPVLVSGADTTHGADWSAGCGAWATTLLPNDMLVAANSTDTDAAQTITSPAITQTGATFGARTQRNASRSTSGTDSGAYSFDASVSTGSANAPTWTHTSATSTCGATAIVRLREGVTGTGLGAFTFGSTASGVPGVVGAAVKAVTFGSTAAGVPGVVGATTAAFTFGSTAQGVAGVVGAALGAFTFTGAASGDVETPGPEGQAAGVFTFAGAASGVPGVIGQGAGAFTFGGTGSGIPGVVGSTTAAFTFTSTGQGVTGVVGATTAAFTFTGAAAGVPGVVATGLGAYAFVGAASGEIAGAVQGQGLAALTFGSTAQGVAGHVGAAAGAFTFSGAASGVAGGSAVQGQAVGSFVFAASSSGVRGVFGTAAAVLAFLGLAVVEGQRLLVAGEDMADLDAYETGQDDLSGTTSATSELDATPTQTVLVATGG